MNDEMVHVENEPLTAIEVRAQVQRIQQVMAAVMKKDTHYGTVPGCGNKPTLLKPGAEKIMATFRLSADPQVEDLSGPDFIRYRVKVNMLAANGGFVGAGIGECSSDEEKYMWRKAVCTEEYDETPEDRRRNKWKAGYQGAAASQTQQVRTNPADIANTVLKMAKKRALVDGVLTATAASDIFTQDIEDMPAEIINQGKGGASKTSSVKATGKATAKTEGRTIQEQLGDELARYCGGDEAYMKEVLKEISLFEGTDGKEKFLTSIKDARDKWAKTSLSKLRAKIKEEGEGKGQDQSLPDGCTKNPKTCDVSTWQAGVGYCGNVDTACPFWEARF